MHKSRNDQRGSAFLMIMLMVVPMFAAVGLVVDIGWAYFTRQAAHTAAEAAALGAAQAAVDGITNGGTYTCLSHGLGCQAATDCPTTIPSPTTTNLQNGCAYAIANGFTAGGLSGKQSVTMQADVSTPAPTVPGVRVKYWVTTRITQQNPLTFGAVLGGQLLNVAVRATGAVIATAPPNCITALSGTASPAMSVSGGSQVNADCGVAVDSSDPNALNLNGAGTVLNADSIQVVGGASGTGMTPTPITGAQPVPDPYADLPAPPASASNCTAQTTNAHYSGGTVTLAPGTYCGGIQVSGGAAITFQEGTYVLLGGGLSVTGSGSSLTNTGTGVMFYNTCNPSPCGAASTGYSSISIGGGTTINLSGETRGLYSGILFYEERTVTGNNLRDSITGNSGVTLTGVLYFPKSELTYSGGSGSVTDYMVIVANTVKITGNSTVGSPFSPSSILSVLKASLIE
jgi:Flp pilus assembly protein TadG